MSAPRDSSKSDNPSEISKATQIVRTVDVEQASSMEKQPDHDVAQLPSTIEPMNWPIKRKYITVMALSLMSTINTTATLACTPAVPQILEDFHITKDTYSTFLVSVWELGEGIGPFFIGPLSESFGRLPVWHTCNALFALCSVACALSVDIHMLVGFRFLNGLVVASITLGPTIVSDIFRVEERGMALAVVSMLPMIGPTFGPLLGSVVSHNLGWRWIFWIVAIITGAVEVFCILVMKETSKTKILQRHTANLPDTRKQVHTSARMDLLRAFKIWVFFPVVLIMAIYLATSYGYQYLVFTTLTKVLEHQFGFSDEAIGLSFIGIGVGSFLGLVTVGPFSDWYVRKMKRRQGTTKPEHRIPPILVGGVLMMISLFLYGWTVQEKVQWMCPIMGTALQGFGLAIVLVSTEAYLVDAFPNHAASASAAGSVLRSLAGAVLPFAGPTLYTKLGLGWGNSLLGFTCAAFLPVPCLLMRFGERVRTRWTPDTVL